MATATQSSAQSQAPSDNWLADFWDKTTDGLTAFTERVSNGLVRLFGASNERTLRRIRPIVDKINTFEPALQNLTDDELRSKTDEFRDRLESGETLADVLPEAFAVCREGGRRFLNMRHYDVQLTGGMVLHEGNIAEMITGEGKTLVATLPAYLNALGGKGVHVVTVNDYLARRDAEWMSPLYNGLGLTVGAIQSDMDPYERKEIYERDITYGTNNEFGFDYLRDNMKVERESQVQGPLNFAIIDEVDSILIDEARTPLIISGPAFDDVRKYSEADRVARLLKVVEHFEIKEKERSCHLTEVGVREAERIAGVDSFYTPGNMEWPHLIDNALKAHHLYKRDREYMVSDKGEVIIIDEFTGRLMHGRQWSDGLHQAVEAKEKVKIKEENQTLATITLQNYFKLYNKLGGMTGTAMTEANEFWKVYRLDVIAIPSNRVLQRVNFPDRIYKTEVEKTRAIINEIREVHLTGRPILVGTTSVAKSEELAHLLELHGIPHSVLNAKYHEKESEIVAQAGSLGRVTIATNMAGRGTDIILGGNPEFMAWSDLKHLKNEHGRPLYPTRLEVPPEVWHLAVAKYEPTMKAEGRDVAARGGLHIVGTERHEARRIDNQLRGRSGRQGDPGSSRFFLSLEDELMRRFIGEFAAKMIAISGLQDDEPIESKMVTRRIEGAQKKIEERNFDIRKNLLEYDEVMDQQRKSVYTFRQRLLDGFTPKDDVIEMIDRQIRNAADNFLGDDYGAASFAEAASSRLGVDFHIRDFAKITSFEEACEVAKARAEDMIEDQIREAMEENLSEDGSREDWNWYNMVNWANTRFGITIRDRDLKAFLQPSDEKGVDPELDREGMADFVAGKGREALQGVNLSELEPLLNPTWGRRCMADWFKARFDQSFDNTLWDSLSKPEILASAREQAAKLYGRKEIEFPVRVAISKFLSERTFSQAPRYDREGLAAWVSERFGVEINLDDLRPMMRHEMEKLLMDISTEKCQANALYKELDELLLAAYGPPVDPTKVKVVPPNRQGLEKLVNWVETRLGMETSADDLDDMNRVQVRNQLTSKIDTKHRLEMREMEKMVILQILDAAWMDHLRAMDHLRSSVGLRGYAQVDPKSEYKREGVKLFDQMWNNVSERVTEMVYRMEQFDPSFLANLTRRQMSKAQVHKMVLADPEPEARVAASSPDEATTNSNQEEKKLEPVRNLGKRVGRNDPCTCGSGKKYKNCCMRL